MTPRSNSWAAPVAVLLAAVVTFVAIDFGLQFVSPVPRIREVADGLRDLRASNPETIVIGSSHARTFHALGVELARRLEANTPLVAIPLEGGKLTGYEWLMRNRVLPLVDERGAGGSRVRSNTKRIVILTEWWDSCALSDPEQAWNIAARAWSAKDYVADVLKNGFTDLNRNYLRERFRVWLPWSVTVQRRGTMQLVLDVAKISENRPSIHTPESYSKFLRAWRSMVERGSECIGDARQMKALEWMLDETAARDLEAVVVLFPRKPDTLTEKGKLATLAPFKTLVEKVVSEHGAKLIDVTTASPLRNEDFMDDFDHVSASGNQVFARWALDGVFAFLLRPGEQLPTDDVVPR